MAERADISAVEPARWPNEAIAKAAIRHGALSEVRIGAAVRALMNAGYVIVPAQQHRAAVEALRRIRRDEGKVCAEFTECEHRACQSSYTAWAIADEALQTEGV